MGEGAESRPCQDCGVVPHPKQTNKNTEVLSPDHNLTAREGGRNRRSGGCRTCFGPKVPLGELTEGQGVDLGMGRPGVENIFSFQSFNKF